jgi:hypothetical protein
MKRATKLVVIDLPQILFELRFQRNGSVSTSYIYYEPRDTHWRAQLTVTCSVYSPKSHGITTQYPISISYMQHPARHCQTVQLQAVSCQDSVE